MGYKEIWGFRQQISKTKYLKISQNIGGKYQEASGEHRSTVQNGCSPIRVDAIRWSEYVRQEKLKHFFYPTLEFLTWTSGVESTRQPDAMAAHIRVHMAAVGCAPIWICGPDALRWCIQTPCPGILLAWIPKNSPQSHIALVIKKLSKHQNLTHFLLELIARVLNMPIELKSDNYYSKVYKRVN